MLFSEEATLLQGLLVSLNIVDFNIIVKDEELDSQETVIDLSMYLRRKEDIGRLNSQASRIYCVTFVLSLCCYFKPVSDEPALCDLVNYYWSQLVES